MSDNTRIRDVCSRFSSGKAISASKVYEEGKYPVYGGNGLRGYTDTFNFDGECAVIGRQGAYCGNVKYFSGKGYMTEHAVVAVANQHNNSRFLAYKFALMDLGRYAGQSAQPGLSVETLLDVEIDVPEKDVQDDIARVLSTIDEKIENNNAICSNLEAMAKLLYDYWFVQFDFPDENGRPYKSSGGKMVWNDKLKREIPEGWEVQKIGDIIYTERGISYSTPNIASGEGVPMLNLATFMPGGGDYKADGLKHFLGDYPKSKTLKPYDLIMCNTQQTAIKFETDIIGRAMLTPDVFDGDVVFSHHVNVIRTDDESLKYYLLFLFNSNYFHKYISGFTNGTNILGLSFNGVEDYLLEIPSHDLLTKFGAVVLETEKKKSAIFKENQQLGELRDFLLPMLMNGQVKVGGVVE